MEHEKNRFKNMNETRSENIYIKMFFLSFLEEKLPFENMEKIELSLSGFDVCIDIRIRNQDDEGMPFMKIYDFYAVLCNVIITMGGIK
jgi:hypothetical protein